jgi:RNA polymerase sigma-70 factor (ECF subfamily)
MITQDSRFDKLANEARPRIYRQAFMLSKNAEDAHDLTQSTLIRAAQSFEKFDQTRSFLNWSLRILHRIFLDDLRMRNRRINAASFEAIVDASDADYDSFDVADPKVDILQSFIQRERDEDVKRLLGCLPIEYQDALYKNVVEGFSYDEIAQMQNTTVGTVRSRIFRAKRIVAAQVEDVEEITV